MNDPLAALRPLHQPAEISWWPPAPGWWILFGLIIATSLWFWFRPRQRTLLQTAMLEVDQIEAAAELQFTELASKSNQLLKRYALARFPEEQIAGLSGRSWVKFLQQHAPEDCDHSIAEVLVEAAYRPSVEHSPREQLLTFTRSWINGQQTSDKRRESRS